METKEFFKPEPYQIFSVNHVIKNPASALFLDMGLGKTVIILTAIAHLKKHGAIKRALIVGPKNVARSVWPYEARKWAHLSDLKVTRIMGTEKQRAKILADIHLGNSSDVYTINRELVPWLCTYFGGSYLPFCMCVIDESTAFKSIDAIRWKMLSKITPYMPYRVIMTGTPIPNGYEDLYAQLFLLDAGERLGGTKKQYMDKFFYLEAIRGTQRSRYKLIPGLENQINEKLKDIAISMHGTDFLKDVPSVSYIDIPIDLDENVIKKYKQFKKHKVLELAESLKSLLKSGSDIDLTNFITAKNAVSLSGKLLQFASGAIYNDDQTETKGKKEYTIIHDEKLDAIEEILQMSEDGVLIACNYQHEYERIEKRLKRYKPVFYKNEKQEEDWNAGKIRVMYANWRSLCYGANLQYGGHTIIWFSPTWNLEGKMQFDARLPRRGQKSRVNIYQLFCLGTEEERVYSRLLEKDKDQQDFIDDLKNDIVEMIKHVL